ncbi:unnamed protein product [Linum trigynum]|uniref:Uncharacterized protein n=1 Tax=Linum trigynum TaxID=586398 RepID=A0AAV2E9S8_9ROSI
MNIQKHLKHLTTSPPYQTRLPRANKCQQVMFPPSSCASHGTEMSGSGVAMANDQCKIVPFSALRCCSSRFSISLFENSCPCDITSPSHLVDSFTN